MEIEKLKGAVMSSIISAIQDFIGILFIGSLLLFTVTEVRLAVFKLSSTGTTKLTPFTQKLTGTTLDLSYDRVYK